MNNSMKKFDVVILTYAPKNDFLVSLYKLLNQEIKPQNIIIVNTEKKLFFQNLTNCEMIKKCLEAKDESKVKLFIINIEKKDFDHGKTRNLAIEFIKSDYVLFMTDDSIPYDRTLSKELLTAFTDYTDTKTKVALVYAQQIAKNNCKISERYVREFNYPNYDIIKDKSKETKLGIKNYFCSNVCAMYDVQILKSNGCFEENIILNEDTYYAYKIINKNYKVIYSSKAKVYHSHNYNYKEQFSRNFDIGVSQCDKEEIFKKIPSTKEGIKLFTYVSHKLIVNFKFLNLFSFVIECIYRYIGFKLGKNYKKLSLKKCIKYSNNKNYFIRGNKNNDIETN